MLQMIRTPLLDQIMCLITTLGNGGAVWILLTGILLINPRTRKRPGMILLAALFVDLILCNGILKNVFCRIRPCDVNSSVQLLISRPHDYSFPSGHTAASFAAVSGLWFSGRKKWSIAALLPACLIAFSRLYLYVHYPTDILGGMAVGIMAGYIGYRAVSLMETRRREKLKCQL